MWTIFGSNEYLVLPSDTFIIDVGANVGLFARYARLVAPGARLLCFEPVASTYDRLLLQLEELVAGGGITCLRKGLAGSVGTRTIYAECGGDVATMFPGSRGANTGAGEEIGVITWDAVREMVRDERVSLLKMDCEGAEWEILGGLEQDALDRVERVCVEYHDVDGRGEPEMTAILVSHGYRVIKASKRSDRTGVVWAVRP